jgi:hypothetical protein
MTFRHPSIPVLTLIVAVGCTSSRGSPFRRAASEGSTTVRVENRYWSDMTISVVRGGARARLGQVSTNGSQSFVIPPDIAAPGVSVYFEADPVGSDQVYRSPLVSLGVSESYVWTLAVNLEHSTLVRR